MVSLPKYLFVHLILDCKNLVMWEIFFAAAGNFLNNDHRPLFCPPTGP